MAWVTCPKPHPHQAASSLIMDGQIGLSLNNILGSESFTRWLISLALEIELVLALDIECYRITASVNHFTCPLPPHQSVIDLPPATNQAVI